MAVINRMNDQQGGGNWFNACVDTNYVQAVRPSTNKGVTIIRPIPEVADDGSIRPMLNSVTPAGPDFSNFRVEPVTINSGCDSRFSGISRASDREEEEHVNMIFPGLFIRLRSREKKDQLPAHLKDKVTAMLSGGMKAQLRPTSDMALLQCVVHTLNGEKFPKPKAKQVVFLTTTAAESISEVLTDAHKRGLDIFSPEEGRMIVLTPEEQRINRNIKIFNAELGDKLPLSEAQCRKLWVPWEKALKVRTFDEQFRAAVRCFGHDVLAFAFPDEYERLYGATTSATPASPATTTTHYEPEDGDDLPGQLEESPKNEASSDVQVEVELDEDLTTFIDDGSSEEAGGAGEFSSSAGEDGDVIDENIDPEQEAKRYQDLLDGDI